MATKVSRETLVAAFIAAEKAALSADPGENADGGTCNFDTATIYLPGVRVKFVEECAGAAGITAYAFKWFRGRRQFAVGVTTRGQASRRTKMAEAACKALKDHGLDAIMYMQLD